MLTDFNKIMSLIVTKDDYRKKRLEKLLSVARDIADRNSEALPDFVRLLGRKLQSDYMCRVVSWLGEHRVPDLEPKLVWFDEFVSLNERGQHLCDLKKNANTTRTLSLASDIVLPWPWHLGRVASCISCIGLDRPAGDWKQDHINHNVEYWLPFGIGWVRGGNHSIMTGIVQGRGAIVTDSVYDMSDLFPHVRFDGNAFLRVSDGSVIQETTEFEFAAIYEVGRLMHELGISA